MSNFLKRHSTIVFFVFSILLVVAIFNFSIVKASNEDISIQAANASINQAFTNVLAAERAGGDISLLLAKLNNAGTLLLQATNAYKTGNTSNATALADNARLIANQVNIDAISLRDSSNRQSQNNMLFTVILSVIASILFLFTMLLIWRRLKRGYNRKLLALKPEVAQN